MEMNDLKKRVDLLKAILGLNDVDIAKKGGISTGTLYRIPKGEVSDKQIKHFASSLGVDYDWLKTGVGDHGLALDRTSTEPKKVSSPVNNMDLMALLAKIEEKWKQDNEYLKERLKAQEETIKSQASTIAAFAEKFLKHEAADFEPHNDGGGRMVVMRPNKPQRKYTDLRNAA